jgi:hypothetical protein
MKRIYIILFFISNLFLQSCRDELDLKPFNQIDLNLAFKTQQDFTNALLGAYTGFQSENYYGGVSILYPDILADNLILARSGRLSASDIYRWQYNPNETWYIWDAAYKVISRANLILENIDNLPDGAFKNNVKGEALAMRALAHFDIVKVYGKIPTQGGALGLGVPYMTSTDITLAPSRNTVEEVYEKLIADFETAKDLINENNDEGRLNAVAVNALLSRAYLYNGEWQKCIDAAQNSIDEWGVNNLRLASDSTEFSDLWNDNFNNEFIFKIANVFVDDVVIGNQYSQEAGEILSEYVIDYGFYQLFGDKDIRKDAYVVTEDYNGKTYNHINKYLGRNAGDPLDTKVIRTSEVYLNKAEAEANLGLDVDAVNDLNEIRSNRYVGILPPDATGDALKEQIKLERRLELAFEGHRFFDLKRWGLKVERSIFGDLFDGSGIPVEAENRILPAGNNKFQFPIALEEINVNRNISQNPGY